MTSENLCVVIPANCTNLNDQGNCTQCDQGFWLDSQGDCNILAANCTRTNDLGNCTEC